MGGKHTNCDGRGVRAPIVPICIPGSLCGYTEWNRGEDNLPQLFLHILSNSHKSNKLEIPLNGASSYSCIGLCSGHLGNLLSC